MSEKCHVQESIQACASRVLVIIPLRRCLPQMIKGVTGRGYVAFPLQKVFDGDSAQVVLSSEVELEPGVKVECVSEFCYLGDTLVLVEVSCYQRCNQGPDL